jgi:hypothetical protein
MTEAESGAWSTGISAITLFVEDVPTAKETELIDPQPVAPPTTPVPVRGKSAIARAVAVAVRAGLRRSLAA